MMHFADHVLREYGYGAITVALMIECAGLLFPGEAIFFCSAIYASRTGHLSISWIIAAAVAGAVLGNALGFVLGRLIGAPLLARYGFRIGLTDRRMALGRYLFRRHGGKLVFFSRFFSVLRSFAPLLAGASGMPLRGFAGWTLAGGIVWPCVHGSLAYLLGNTAKNLAWPFQAALGLLLVGLLVAVFRYLKRNEQRLEAAALLEEHSVAGA